MDIDSLPDTRRMILYTLKRDGPLIVNDLAEKMGLTGEAIRQHLLHLQNDGWVERIPGKAGCSGRPAMHYSLTKDGEHLFPKAYDELSIELLDTVAGQLGEEALEKLLISLTEARVQKWEPQLRGLSLEERAEALKNFYLEEHSFMQVEQKDGELRLIERNCPFLNVAMRRPILCSVTVSSLSRLLGYRVVREEKFQNGDGRCVFRVQKDQPIDPDSPVFTRET